jgi:hypothetical protein
MVTMQATPRTSWIQRLAELRRRAVTKGISYPHHAVFILIFSCIEGGLAGIGQRKPPEFKTASSGKPSG